jgi:uncharacterized membrane protein YjjB (DUF3815 family)
MNSTIQKLITCLCFAVCGGLLVQVVGQALNWNHYAILTTAFILGMLFGIAGHKAP